MQVALVMEPKDKEASIMYKQALELLSQALEVWPNANVKFNYLEKLLSSTPSSQSKDPSTALAQGLDVMNKVLEKQPHLFVRNNINQISQVCVFAVHPFVAYLSTTKRTLADIHIHFCRFWNRVLSSKCWMPEILCVPC